MKQKRKVKSQNFTEKGANKILASWLILLGGILCFGAASLFMTPKVLGQLTVLSYTGIESKNEVVYHMDFVAPKDQTIVVNEMFMKENNGERNFYMSGGSVVLAEYNMSEESLKGINNVGTGKYANILGGESNNVDSSNVTIIAGERNNVSERNDNATVMGLVSGSVSVGNGGVPLVLVGGSNNKIGNNQNGTVIVGGDSNNIGHAVTSSWILGGENNQVMANNAIVAGSNVSANDAGASDIFVFSDRNGSDTNGGFMPKSPNSFYLDVENGVGLNTPAGNNGGLASKGAISIGDLNEGACTTENVGMQGVLSGCLVGCTKDGLELLDTSEGCLKKFGKEPPIPDEPNPELGACFIGNVDISHASRCGNPAGYANTLFQVKLIDAKTNPDGSSSSITCPSGDNQCVYQCDDGYHLVGDKCYKDCGLDGKKIKHGDSGIWYDQSSVECGDGKTCSSHGRSLSCNDGDLYYNGVKVDNSNPYKHASCQLTNHNVNRNLYPLTEAEIDRTRGNYVPDTGYTANNAQDKCEPGTVYYYLDDCYTNYTKVGGRDGKCYEKCSYTGNHDVDHGIRKGFYENETECRSNDKNGQCTGVIMKSCNDGTWTPGGGHVSCSLTEVSCNPDEPDVENIDGQCSTTEIYKCVKGEAVDKNYNNNVWTWKCKGSGAGTTGDCEIIPETSYSCIGTYPAGATPSSQTPVANMNWYCAPNTNNACSYTCQKGQECNGTNGCKNAVYKCNPGTYLKKGDTKCTQCPCGNYCTGGNFTYNTSKDQGINACGGGKYSEAGASSCLKISCGYYGSSACSATPNKCEDGTYSEEGSSQCSTCTSGQPDTNQCACVGGKNCTGTAPGNNTKKSSVTPTSSTGWKYVSNTDAELKACEWTCADSNFERDGNTTNCTGKTLQCEGNEPPVNADRSESTYTYEGTLKYWESTTYLVVNGNWPCEWKCKSGRTGSDCSEPIPKLVPGECGSADGTTISIPPSSESEKCSIGSSSEVDTKTSTYEWACTKDTPKTCSAYRYPVCGSADGTTISIPPSSESEKCSIGSSSGIETKTSTYEWTCSNGSKSVDCSANIDTTPPPSAGCSPTTTGDGTCSYNISALAHGGSDTFPTITKGYTGSVYASCSNGKLTYSNKTCTKETQPGSKGCSSTTTGDGTCSYDISALAHGGSDTFPTTTDGYIGSIDASCSNGKLTYSNKSCEKIPSYSGCKREEHKNGKCTYSISALAHGGSDTFPTTTDGYTGSVDVSCSNGKLTYSNESCTELPKSGCSKSGACKAANHGAECTSYDRCSSTPITSVCNDGTWEETPGEYSGADQQCYSCKKSGACKAADHGAECTTYLQDQYLGTYGCSSVERVSTCNDGKWDLDPYNYTDCTTYCDTSGGCGVEKEGSACTSYKVKESNDCDNEKVESICSSTGSWLDHPGAWTECTAPITQDPECGDSHEGSSASFPSDTCKVGELYGNVANDTALHRYDWKCKNGNKTVSCYQCHNDWIAENGNCVNNNAKCQDYKNEIKSCTQEGQPQTQGIAAGTWDYDDCSCSCPSHSELNNYGECEYDVPNPSYGECDETMSFEYPWWLPNATCATDGWSCQRNQYSAGGDVCECTRSVQCQQNQSCGAQGACPETSNGETCTTYKVSESLSCTLQKVDSKCENGTWSNPPQNYTGCKIKQIGGSPSCFLAGTQVYMADGSTKNIEDIEVGDLVITYNIDLGKWENHRVFHKYVHENSDDELYELTIDGNVLKVTEVHRFYVTRQGFEGDNENQCTSPYRWIEARYLHVGDKVLKIDGSDAVIEEIIHHSNYSTTYNLGVEKVHNYFVDEGYLVHNSAKDKVSVDEGTGGPDGNCEGGRCINL